MSKKCPNCHMIVADNLFFCDCCGSKLNLEMPQQAEFPNSTNTKLTVFRESQFVGSAMNYDVIINDQQYGRIAVGKKITSNINQTECTVKIASASNILNQSLILILKLKECEVQINLKIKMISMVESRIIATVTGAEILKEIRL